MQLIAAATLAIGLATCFGYARKGIGGRNWPMTEATAAGCGVW
jgi:hypothetical protein